MREDESGAAVGGYGDRVALQRPLYSNIGAAVEIQIGATMLHCDDLPTVASVRPPLHH
jgi:hypothetical protein